jgi:hypothetical protein
VKCSPELSSALEGPSSECGHFVSRDVRVIENRDANCFKQNETLSRNWRRKASQQQENANLNRLKGELNASEGAMLHKGLNEARASSLP